MDNIGKVNSDRSRYYYIKDHLGSVRVTLDESGSLVYAQDYDCWGYPLMSRKYENVTGDKTNKYRFTSKERDKETIGNDYEGVGYDYFGARYYDSRIGRWGGVEPLMDKYLSHSPYSYTLNNSLLFSDADGLKVRFSGYEYDVMLDRLSWNTSLDIEFSQVEKGVLTTKKLSNEEYYDLDADDRYLYDAITNGEFTAEINSLEFPMTEKGFFVGGAIGPYLDGGKMHYYNEESAYQIEQLEIYTRGKTIKHEILEIWFEIFGYKGEKLTQSKSHLEVAKLIPYGRHLSDFVTYSTPNSIYTYLPGFAKPITFYEYEIKAGFNWVNVLEQLENQKK